MNVYSLVMTASWSLAGQKHGWGLLIWAKFDLHRATKNAAQQSYLGFIYSAKAQALPRIDWRTGHHAGCSRFIDGPLTPSALIDAPILPAAILLPFLRFHQRQPPSVTLYRQKYRLELLCDKRGVDVGGAAASTPTA